MREILFRGKGVNDNAWHVGSLLKVTVSEQTYFLIIGPDFAQGFDFRLKVTQHALVDPETVGQYTGISDRKSMPVFEGDIIKSHYANATKSDFVEPVVFHNGKFCGEKRLSGGGKAWAPLWDGVPHVSFDKSVYMDSLEIIGNIHDNPEILGRRKE